MPENSPAIAADANCELGENPLWNPEKNCIYWTDISAGKIFRFDIATQKFGVVYEGESVGGFTIQENGELLLFRVNDIALLSAEGKVSVVRAFSEGGMTRFNDVIADPAGRVFAGTIAENPESGGLYRVDLDGTITKLFNGTDCSNGMGFSPDLRKFYWTNSTTREIFQFDYDRSSGNLENRKLFYRATPDEKIPDGLTVDAEGCIWSARWGGSSIKRHAPDGTVTDSISFPVENITSMCFAGANMDELFITSAKNPDHDEPSAGALFHLKVQAKGGKEFRSKICVAI